MKSRILVFALLISSLLSCQTNKSIEKDLVTGLITKGNGLSCSSVYLSDETDKIQRNSFTYGEKFYINFADITGFEKGDNNAHPGMELLILDQKRDTMLHLPDMYEKNTDGYESETLLLKANIIAASPIHTAGTYTYYINIWDKKGSGTFKAEMEFKVQADDDIKIDSQNISYDEIYLFSKKSGLTIIDGKANINETIFVIFEGLNGFVEEEGKATIGLKMLAKDANGKLLLDEKDLLANAAMNTSEVKAQFAPNFIFSNPEIKNPVTCEVLIWDKKSEHFIKAITTLTLQ